MAVYSTICISWVCYILLFSANLVFCGAPVKYLPGYDGELPFKLETGYISVDTSELFYYFIETEGNPKEDPLLLWYSGGPGCSAFNGLIYEIGPLAFNITDYEGGLPQLMYYEYGWTKSASILFVDAPVGTGFSYSTTTDGWPTSDKKSAYQTYQFLRKWLLEHPQFLKVQLFIGADSYSGVNAPIIVQHVLDGNKDGIAPHMNLKGYTFGCPLTDVIISENAKITASHRLGLISDELYESAKTTCLGDYITNKYTIPDCYRDTAAIDKLIQDINSNNILDPTCTWAAPQPKGESHPRSLSEDIGESAFREDVGKNVLSQFTSPKLWCHEFNYSLSYAWANDKAVQDALHVRNGTIGDWKRCNESLSNTVDALDTFDLHKNFSKLGLQALIYNGDHDLVVPNIATQEWITNLDLTIVNDWRPWLVDGETAGYTIKYSENGYRLTYATIKGAGHAPQEYKRRECFQMFDRWIHWYPL